MPAARPRLRRARFDLANVSVRSSVRRSAAADGTAARGGSRNAVLALKAQVLRLVGRNDEAIALMEQAVAAVPTMPSCGCCTATCCARWVAGAGDRGLPAGARDAAGLGEAYWSLANLKTFRFDARPRSHAAAAGRQRARSRPRPPRVRARQGSRGRRAVRRVLRALRAGNALHRATLSTAEVLHEVVQRSKTLYVPRVLRRARPAGAASGAIRSSLSACRARLDAARADPREPLAGRGHARVAGTAARSCGT